MGTKKKAPQPDADGYVDTGIYQHATRDAKATPYDPEVLQRAQTAAERSIEERLQAIRGAVWPILEPFLQPWKIPFDPTLSGTRERLKAIQEAEEPILKTFLINVDATPSGKVISVEFGEGRVGYRTLPAFEESTVEANQARDALEILHEAGEVAHCLGKDEIGLFETAFRLGQLCERINIRPFEPHVLSEKGRRNRKLGTGARLTADQWAHVEEFIRTRTSHGLSAAKAAEEAASQLRSGAFKALTDVVVDLEAKTLENRYSRRGK